MLQEVTLSHSKNLAKKKVKRGLVPRYPLQKPPSRGLEGSGRGGDEGLKVEGGFEGA